MILVKGINQDIIQQMNRVLIIRLMRMKGVCSRAELSRLTKLRPATITNIISEFQQWGLVREEGFINEGIGRKAIGITLNSLKYKVIALRLSRKYFLIGLFDLSGNELQSIKHKISKKDTPEIVFNEIKKQIHILLNNCHEGRVLAIGCAIPGPFLRKEGRVALLSEFPDWQNIKIKQELENEFGFPTYLEHDANAGALAYYWDMGVETNKSLVYFAAGQGIGAGIVSDGSLLVGALGSAGEVGHMCIDYNGAFCECGNKGCLEKYCSSIALTKAINRKLDEGNYSILSKGCDFGEIAEAVQKGDKLAVSEYRKACEMLAVGVVNIINILNPDIVVIGDEMSTVEPEILIESVNNVVKSRILPVILENMIIVVGKENTDKILTGASIVATEEILKTPFLFKSEGLE